MSGGWFPMWRSTWDSYINDLPEGHRWVAATLFMMVATKPKQRRSGKDLITVNPGQVYVTIRELATRANVSKGVAERTIKALTTGGTIAVDAGRHGMLITLLSYEDFRLGVHDPQDKVGTKSGQEQDKVGTPRGTPRKTAPLIKEEEREEKTVARERAAKLPGYAETIAVFDGLYQKHSGGAKPTWGAKQGRLVKDLLKVHGPVEVQRRMRTLFTAAPEWIESRDIGTLAQHFDKLVTPARVNGAGRSEPIPVFRGLSR